MVGGLALIAAAGALFHIRQNGRAKMGGAISGGKSVWLGYAIYLWFVLCPVLAFDPAVPGAQRVVLGTFGASMWLRGLAELYLLFVGHAWRPPYGMGHDGFCLALMGGEIVWLRDGLANALASELGRWGAALLGVVCVSLVLELVYAWGFYRLVRGATTGAEGIWFASEKDARFRGLVRLTAWANVPLCAFLLCFLAAVLR